VDGFFILFVIAIAAIVIPLAIRSAKRTNESWASVSQDLDLRSTPAKLGQKRRISGLHHGMQVEVDTFTRRHGKSSTTYTRFHVHFPQNLRLGLQLTTEGFFSGITKAFGAQDIETGGVSFDDGVIVKGADPRRVLEFLTPTRQERIRHFLESHSGAVITDTGVLWSRRGLVRDHSQLVSCIRRIADFARCFTDEGEEDAAERPLLEGGTVEAQEALTETVVPDLEDEPAPVEPVASGPDELELITICEELFQEGASSFEVTRLFEEGYQHQRVRGSGVLTEAQEFAYDFVFDSKDGSKAVLEIGETETGAYGRKMIFAVVQLPAGAAAELAGHIGETVTFRGVFAKADGFMRNVFVAEGVVELA
jgi:hypothetical protein